MLYDPLMPPKHARPDPFAPTPERLTELIDFVNQNPMATLVIAIDPGDEHVGVAIGGFPPSTNSAQHPWEPIVYRAEELTPAECLYFAAHSFKVARAVVIETFRLYADKATAQIGSTMPTSRLIGALEYIAAVAVEGASYSGVPIRSLDNFLYMQGADIKTGTIANLKARGTPSFARTHKKGGHALDAELHFYYFMYDLLKKRDAALAEANPEKNTQKKSRFDSTGLPSADRVVPKPPTMTLKQKTALAAKEGKSDGKAPVRKSQ